MSVYTFSDLHGMYPLWKQIKEYIKPNDLVYCLGDCADRGPEGWKIMKEVLDTPNIIYLMGNHEQFIRDEDYYLWRYNGGAPTIEAYAEDTDENWRIVKEKIDNLPYMVKYTKEDGNTIALCHAGFNPETLKYWDSEELVWNRNHYFYDWPQNWDDLIIIHGHTPIPYLAEEIGMEDPKGALWYADGHKCCIDKLSFLTGEAILLNLNTFEEVIFKMDDVEEYKERY